MLNWQTVFASNWWYLHQWFTGIIGNACIVCRAGSMRHYGVRPSLHLSLPAWAHSSNSAAAGLLLRVQRAGEIDRRLQQQSAAGECCQCHVVSIRRQLNTDLVALRVRPLDGRRRRHHVKVGSSQADLWRMKNAQQIPGPTALALQPINTSVLVQ